MIKFRMTGLAIATSLAYTISEANATCNPVEIDNVLLAPLDPSSAEVRELDDPEGLEWAELQIYRDSDGKAVTVLRIDGWETYNDQVRLSLVNDKTWGISRTVNHYLTKIESGGPLGIKRAEADYYFFCDGKLLAPDAVENVEAYSASAKEQQERLFRTRGVRNLFKSLQVQ